MANTKTPKDAAPKSPGRSGRSGRYVTVKNDQKHPGTKVSEGKYDVKSSSGGMIIGRNAVSGKFVLAPAVKAGSAFRSHKSEVVREVIRNKRDK